MSYHCFSEKLTTAKDVHRCIWCGHRILTASKYIRERSIYDGHHQNMAWHEACRSDALAGWRAGHDEEFMPHDAEMPFFALYQLEATSLADAPSNPHPAGEKEGRS